MNRQQSQPLTVGIPEACRITGIGRSKLYELIKSGEIGIIKVGTITLVPLDGLKRYLGISSDGLSSLHHRGNGWPR